LTKLRAFRVKCDSNERFTRNLVFGMKYVKIGFRIGTAPARNGWTWMGVVVGNL
jgi:hypothetical protein